MIGFFKNLLLVGELQQMIGLMVLVKSGVHKIFLTLWFTVITVSHHQIPVYLLVHGILRYVKGILASADILDDGSSCSAFLKHLPKCRILILLSCLYRSLGQNPALVPVLEILVQKQYLPAENNHTATACCFYHCNSSCKVCTSVHAKEHVPSAKLVQVYPKYTP